MSQPPRAVSAREAWLLAATFLVAVAGLIYELIAATLSSYLLGDSVRQFSFVIGVFLSAMGVGAWVSRFVANALPGFVWAQISLGIVGGFMAPALYFFYAFQGDVSVLLYAMLGLVGVLSGMEIPLIARVLDSIGAREHRFENVLTVDYIGALIASISFPLLVVPHLGLMSASLVFGCLNLCVAGLSLWLFRADLPRAPWAVWALAMAATLAALVHSERLVSVVEANLYSDDIILSETTPYQQITVTRFRERTRLYLNTAIQFDTLDEHRYHESLVHPAMARAPRRNTVLILGGGDGMAAREVLKYPDVAAITLVDLDPRVTELFATNPDLAALNDNALNDPRVTLLNTDAWQFVQDSTAQFDVIILDLPDPKNLSLSKLYSLEFYGMVMERLSGTGLLATHAGSPLFARQAFWSIVETLEATRNPSAPGQALTVLPYHAYVPSFGQWGFALASAQPLAARALDLPADLRFLTPEVWTAAQTFPPDTARLPAEVNTIRTHALTRYYLEGWEEWFD